MTDKNIMYINAQPPPPLTVAVPAEISVHREAESQPLKLQPFQIVRATVAEAGLDKVVLQLNQHRLTADTEVPLKNGQNLNLQVLSVNPQIRFRIVEEAELKYLFRALHSLDQNIRVPVLIELLQNRHAQGFEPFSEKIQHLLEALKLWLRSDPGNLKGRDLAMIWNRLGLDMEVLLAGGKKSEAKTCLKSSILLHLKDLYQQGKASEIIESTLDQLKLFQLCRLRLAQENVFFVPLPFEFLEKGYLFAEKWKHQENDPDRQNPFWKMTLSLKLSFLGNLQILLLFENLDLRLRILCDSDDKVEIISRFLCRLKDSLTTVSLCSYSVGTGAEDPGRYLVRRLASENDHFLRTEV